MGVAETGRIYSRNHCLTRIPMNADDKATTRLTNQRELITMAEKEIENDPTPAARERGSSSLLVGVYPFSFVEISCSNMTVVSAGFAESHL